MYTIRITVVGDGDTGKTSILIAYKDKAFNDQYIPTVFDQYSLDIPIGNEIFHVILQDTAGQEEFDKLRRFAYNETDVFIMCYSLDNRDSFTNIRDKWAPELKALRPRTKLILIGTKRDLRKKANRPVTREEGERLARQIKADGFLETSAKKMINVEQTFQLAFVEGAKLIKSKHKKHKSTCFML